MTVDELILWEQVGLGIGNNENFGVEKVENENYIRSLGPIIIAHRTKIFVLTVIFQQSLSADEVWKVYAQYK